MDISKLQREPEVIKKDFTKTKDGRLVTKTGCYIYLPARFVERGLAEIGNEAYVLGLCAIVNQQNQYAVLNVNARVRLLPSSTNKVVIEGADFYEFVFDKGATVIANTSLVKEDTLLYKIYQELIEKGRVPWYLAYEDLGKLFVTAKYHAGPSLAANNAIIEMIVASISRSPDDRTVQYRHFTQSLEHQRKNPPKIVPLDSPIYGPNNTTTKIIGSYFDNSLASALTDPSDKVEGVEELLRK